MPKTAFPLHVKAVAIDLDGTMLDTVEDLAIAVNMMLQRIGRAPLDQLLVRNFVGKGINNLVERSLVGALEGKPDAATFEKALPIYMECYAEVNGRYTTQYPQVREGLEALKAAGFQLACVTNKSERYTLPLLAQTKLDSYFSLVVAGDTLAKKKPDPLPLTHVAEKFGVKTAQLLMIGDSLNDAQAARAAGCPIFCVGYGYNEGADVRSLDVDAIVETILDASKLIARS
jgi:phosphoglycolate phosphatase